LFHFRIARLLWMSFTLPLSSKLRLFNRLLKVRLLVVARNMRQSGAQATKKRRTKSKGACAVV